MQFHYNLAEAVITCITTIFTEHKYADKVIEKTLRSNPKWGSRDRGFIAENVYDIVRYFKLYQHILQQCGEKDDNYFVLFAVHYHLKNKEIPTRSAWKHINWEAVDAAVIRCSDDFAIHQSYTEWFLNKSIEQYSGVAYDLLKKMNEPARLILRANTLKVRRNFLVNYFNELKINTTELGESALILDQKSNVFALDIFKEGCFEVQDFGSQMISEFTQVEPGMRVIDACAGAGGKSLHLAMLMNNKGKILSLDVEEFKLIELKKRARRNGVSIVETKIVDNQKTIKRLQGSADVVLIDAPCSGSGVIRRNPDSKWKINNDKLNEMMLLQETILQSYAELAKPGGVVVYATCSIWSEENENQVLKFLMNNSNFELLEERKISPLQYESDGYYMAKMKRTATPIDTELEKADDTVADDV